MMDKRKLGNTDIEVSPIGIGVMQFSGGKGMMGNLFPKIDQENKNEIIKAAIDGGVNFFDTAQIYGNGMSERSLSDALKSMNIRDEDVIIGTKWMPLLKTAKNIPKTIGDRLNYLNGYTIDLFMVHAPISFSPIRKQMKEMANLFNTGKIRSVGVSNFSAKQMQKAHDSLEEYDLPLAVNQVQYSLLQRKIETNGVLDKAKELGVTIIAYTPLGSGLLTGNYHNNPELLNKKGRMQKRRIMSKFEKSRNLIKEMDKISQINDVTTGQVALNWLINFNGDTVITIPGASKVKHSAESAGAMSFTLNEEELSIIDKLSIQFK